MPLIRSDQKYEYVVAFRPITVVAQSEDEAIEKALEEDIEVESCIMQGLA